MSSACVCHTSEWCFYCNMYTPLERKYDDQRNAIELLIEDYEHREDVAARRMGESPYVNDAHIRLAGNREAYRLIIRELKEVLADESDHTRNTP